MQWFSLYWSSFAQQSLISSAVVSSKVVMVAAAMVVILQLFALSPQGKKVLGGIPNPNPNHEPEVLLE